MDYQILMELASQLGTRLAVAGAETYRIEESIVRVLAAYGLDSRVYSVPNSLFITIMVPGELPITQLCRMKSIGTDLDAVEKYNNFSRAVCEKKPDPEVALQWLEETDLHSRVLVADKRRTTPTVSTTRLRHLWSVW